MRSEAPTAGDTHDEQTLTCHQGTLAVTASDRIGVFNVEFLECNQVVDCVRVLNNHGAFDPPGPIRPQLTGEDHYKSMPRFDPRAQGVRRFLAKNDSRL